SGPGLVGLSPAERAVLANATPEAVAATATFPVDQADAPALAEDKAATGADLVLDLSSVQPSVARSGQPSDVVTLNQLSEAKVDQVFVGTCAGGTYEEIRDFVSALGTAPVAVPTIVAPASLDVEQRLR